MPVEFEIKETFSATPETVYNAWLDGEEHGEMTGGAATCSPQIGTPFSAWDGYISGTNLMLKQNERIVQIWRTEEFAPDDPDSRLEILLKPVKEGCELTLIHKNIPDGQPDYAEGWVENYFEPMQAYFGK